MNGAAIYSNEMDRERVELLLKHREPMRDDVDEIVLEEAEGKKYSHQGEIRNRFLNLEWDEQCYFSDGKRQIDYVLAYEDDPGVTLDCLDIDSDSPTEDSVPEKAQDKTSAASSADSQAEKRRRRRENFEANLQRMGLEIERKDIDPLLGRTRFVLIHAPFHVLEKQAQILGVKLPVKECDLDFRDTKYFPGVVDATLAKLQVFEFDDEVKKLLEEPEYYMSLYSPDRRQHFVNWDRPDILFPNAERSRMVYDLLTRANFDDPKGGKREAKHFGIDRLLSSYTYNAAYPLHQVLRNREEFGEGGGISQREVLLQYWVSWRNILKYQPLDCIKRYFGSKIAFYFAWLGYYTRSLYIAAFVGIICVIYGLLTVSEDVVSNDICGTDGIGSEAILCPACESYCDFKKLNDSCLYAKVSYMFDNTATVIFAALMSIWATLFLEGWKRYHAEIAWKWGLMDQIVDEDTVRPDFQFRVKTTRFNPVTSEDEPYLPTKKKILNFLASGVTVLFFICLVLAVVFGMIVYRVILMQVLAMQDSDRVDAFAFIIVSTTAATINLIVILIMNMVYNSIALRLTRWECPRTQADFDNSYTFKVFLFQFVNYYSSLFYIAFFKGLLSQLPGKKDIHGNVKIGGHRLEGCDAAGCFAELVIQLAIIMCGKQFFSAVIEFFYPSIMGLLRKWQLGVPAVVETEEQKKQRIREEKTKKAGNSMKRWESDYYLNPTYDQFLFDEYLEMVLQFGFVTLFVAAFPLAPLFALINNVMEIRIDAYKFLCTTQRPIPAQARNIGVWLNILDVISKASVTINALVIAFTSDFVPKTMYYFTKGDMLGYVNSSLAHFDATDFDDFNFSRSQFKDANITMCRYRGYRKMPCSLSSGEIFGAGDSCDNELGFSYEWWKIFAARLLFVVVFEHIVFVIKILVEYLIPDVPTRIFLAQQRERYLIRKALLGDLSGTTSPRTPSQSAAHEDREDVAFQPGSFKNHEVKEGPVKRKDTVASMDSFVTAYGNGGSVMTLNELNNHKNQ